MDRPLIAGRYRLQRELGQGAAGVVYLADDERLQRRVAIKLLHPHQQHDVAKTRFLTEARAAAKLEHPSLCPVFDFGAHGSRFYLVMAHVDGPALSQVLATTNPLPIDWVIQTITQIAEAMSAAHAAGVTHLDLKPDNILVRRDDGRPIVTDFGLAGAPAQAIGNASAAGKVFFGTPAYMSPEQANGQLPLIGPASDVYSLGATFYELLTGQLPILGTLDELLTRLRDPNHVPLPAIKIRPTIPPPVSEYCAQLLAKSPIHRPSSMSAVVARLRQWDRASSPASTASSPVITPSLPVKHKHKRKTRPPGLRSPATGRSSPPMIVSPTPLPHVTPRHSRLPPTQSLSPIAVVVPRPRRRRSRRRVKHRWTQIALAAIPVAIALGCLIAVLLLGRD